MTLVDILAPQDDQEGTESQLGQWFKSVGDYVEKNDPILEINTDKVTLEVAAPVSGILEEVLVGADTPITPGIVLGRIKPQEQVATTGQVNTKKEVAPVDTATKPTAQRLSPAVRKLLEKHGLTADQVTGTGKDGRITADDVKLAAQTTASATSKLIPHKPMRKKVAEHMVQSLLQTAPHVTSVFEADLTSVINHRDSNKVEFESKGAKLTYTAYFVKAAVTALQAVPEVNSRWHADNLEVFSEYNIGIAVALEKDGLVVPVLRNVEQLDLLEIAKGIQDLSSKARASKLERSDLEGGTFTISNHGVSGSLFATPIIINQPQSAILGIGKLENRVKWDSETESAKAYPCCYVSLTIDHRVLDGFQANSFLSHFVEALDYS